MANQEQLDILKQGVGIWNEWRKENPSVQIDLSHAHLSGADLREANLNEANLNEADLNEADLTRADLSGAYHEYVDLNFEVVPYGAHLSSAHLSRARLSSANLTGADLNNADLTGADLSSAYLFEAHLCGADLSSANLTRATLSYAKLSEANLVKAPLCDANLTRANLSSANLSYANLSGANLSSANLSYANLSGANLSDANLFRAGLLRADLSRADLSYVDLRGAYLSEANLTDAIVGWTSVGDVDLSVVKNLETVKHREPSSIGIDTIYLSHGNIPEVFLKGAGVDDTFISYIRSLVGKPIEYYSCFISYSSKDDAFARRLHADLQSHNVRCWFAPEDLKIGDKIRTGIDEAIRLHDKLLLILSKSSVDSGWVEREVKAALAKERKAKRTVLFPVRVDKAVFESPFDWATEIRHERNIGDFTRWKNHDDYEKAFSRLLRDLKSVT